jgi:hypothetical protein
VEMNLRDIDRLETEDKQKKNIKNGA